jgi:hypothetical protein
MSDTEIRLICNNGANFGLRRTFSHGMDGQRRRKNAKRTANKRNDHNRTGRETIVESRFSQTLMQEAKQSSRAADGEA